MITEIINGLLDYSIDAKAYEALAILEGLETIQVDKNINLDSRPSVLRIKMLIRELRQMEAEKEARIIEIDLEKKLTALRQKIVAGRKPALQIEPKLKISAKDRKRANRSISNLLQQSPEKSILQILPILVKYEDWDTVRVAVDRIEEHQKRKLTLEDLIYLKKVKEKLQQIRGKNQ